MRSSSCAFSAVSVSGEQGCRSAGVPAVSNTPPHRAESQRRLATLGLMLGWRRRSSQYSMTFSARPSCYHCGLFYRAACFSCPCT